MSGDDIFTIFLVVWLYLSFSALCVMCVTKSTTTSKEKIAAFFLIPPVILLFAIPMMFNGAHCGKEAPPV